MLNQVPSAGLRPQTGVLSHSECQPVCETGCEHHKDNDLTRDGISKKAMRTLMIMVLLIYVSIRQKFTLISIKFIGVS